MSEPKTHEIKPGDTLVFEVDGKRLAFRKVCVTEYSFNAAVTPVYSTGRHAPLEYHHGMEITLVACHDNGTMKVHAIEPGSGLIMDDRPYAPVDELDDLDDPWISSYDLEDEEGGW